MHGTWKYDMTMPGMWIWAQVAQAQPMIKETRHPNIRLQTCYTDTQGNPHL